MASFRQAFALSKDEVKNATPPGTATLVGTSSELTVIVDPLIVFQNTSNGLHHNRATMRSVWCRSRLRTQQTP